MQDTQAGWELQNRLTFAHRRARPALTFTGNVGTLFCTAHQ